MNQSKLELTKRLEREGRWEEASQWKDSRIKYHRSKGNKRPEAQALAWEEMEAKYPPVEVPEEVLSAPGFSPEVLASLPPGSFRTFMEDAEWVYANLESGCINVAEPPSTGAVALLTWARTNRDAFYSKILPRGLEQIEQQREKDEKTRKEELQYNEDAEEVLRMLKGST